MQCPRCYYNFCWVCLQQAKGQKHYKERPQCLEEDAHLQPETLTKEMIIEYIGNYEQYINLKFCAKSPCCGTIVHKDDRNNLL